jgi:hypothetical protein
LGYVCCLRGRATSGVAADADRRHLAGALELDNALDLDLTSFLYPSGGLRRGRACDGVAADRHS